jgi:hypothetical protein
MPFQAMAVRKDGVITGADYASAAAADTITAPACSEAFE